MGIEYLLNLRLFLVWVNVPDFEFAAKSSNEKMIFIDLVQKGWTLLVVDLLVDVLVSSFDVDVDNQDLFIVEARHSQNRRRRLQECLRIQLNNSVSSAWFRTTDQDRSHRWLGLLLLVLLLFVFFVIDDGFLDRGFFFFFIILSVLAFWLFLWNDNFFDLGLGLQMGQLFLVTVEVKQLRDSVRLTQR